MEAVKGEAKALREVLHQQQQKHSQQDSVPAQEVSALRRQLAEAEQRCREAEQQLAQLPDAEKRRGEAEEKLHALELQLVSKQALLPSIRPCLSKQCGFCLHHCTVTYATCQEEVACMRMTIKADFTCDLEPFLCTWQEVQAREARELAAERAEEHAQELLGAKNKAAALAEEKETLQQRLADVERLRRTMIDADRVMRACGMLQRIL